MFRFTRKVDYSLLLLSELSLTDGQSARVLADRYRLSQSLVANLLKLLVRTGFVKSIRGKSGGYILAREQAAITLAEVVEKVDGPYSLVDCMDERSARGHAHHEEHGEHGRAVDDDQCSLVEVCPCRPLFSLMHDEIMAIMRKYTIADIHRGCRSAKDVQQLVQFAPAPVSKTVQV